MDFFDQLVRLETDLWNAVERELLDRGQVGLGTLQALRVVGRHGGSARVQDLSRELSITIGAASKVVDRLERDGLATRSAHPQDRRSSLVALTDSGQRAARNGERVARKVVADLLGDAEDLAPLLAGIVRLQERLDSLTAGARA